MALAILCLDGLMGGLTQSEAMVPIYLLGCVGGLLTALFTGLSLALDRYRPTRPPRER